MALFEDRNKPVNLYNGNFNTLGKSRDKQSRFLEDLAVKQMNPLDTPLASQDFSFKKPPSRNVGKINPMNTYDKDGNPLTLSKIPNISKSLAVAKATADYRNSGATTGDMFGASLPEEQKVKALANLQGLNQRQAITSGLREIADPERDKELGKMSLRSETIDDGQRNTLSIGDNNLSYKLSDNDLAIKKSIEKIDAAIAGGLVPNAEQQKRIDEIRRQAGFTRGGTDRGTLRTLKQPKANNLDIQFDDSVDPAARERFLENPMRPTAQIDRFNANRGVEGDTLKASSQAARNHITNKTPQNELYTRENSPNMGRKERSLMNKKLLDNQQSEENTFATLAEKRKSANQTYKMDSERNAIARERNAIAAGKPIKRDSKVINQYDDLTGQVIGQKIVQQDANGNWPGQSNNLPKFNNDQKARAVAYSKANPNMNKTEILQKIANGEI